MNFIHSDLGNLEKGRIVEIVLKGNAANVPISIIIRMVEIIVVLEDSPKSLPFILQFHILVTGM